MTACRVRVLMNIPAPSGGGLGWGRIATHTADPATVGAGSQPAPPPHPLPGYPLGARASGALVIHDRMSCPCPDEHSRPQRGRVKVGAYRNPHGRPGYRRGGFSTRPYHHTCCRGIPWEHAPPARSSSMTACRARVLMNIPAPSGGGLGWGCIATHPAYPATVGAGSQPAPLPPTPTIREQRYPLAPIITSARAHHSLQPWRSQSVLPRTENPTDD